MVETRTVPLESLDSSDDEPLIALVKKKPQHMEHNGTQGEKDQNRQPEPESKNSTRKDSGLDDTSDDEPLTKLLNKLSRAKKATVQARPRTTDIKRGTDSSSGDSSDDVPLINMVDKLKTQMRTKTPTTTARKTPGIKKPRKVFKKHNRSIETSDDSSDDEPLINLTKKSPSKETERTILKRCVTKESNSNNCNKIEGKMSREEEVSSDSDDKPLINLVKKPLKAVKKTTTPLKKRSVSGKTVVARKKTRPDIMNKDVIRRSTKVLQRTREGSLDDSSDDEPLSKKMVRNPQMKSLMVILERCDTKEVLEDNYRANVGNTGKRSAGDKENSDDELLIKMVTNPPHSSPETMAEKENKSETALTMNL
ncbi:nucleolar protein dao-5-like isoform X11 [Oncorhynchus clarkii lewisi]|uniref:nucleolar protein dao-5-like isoform X11 n=1 Tax=Oncorhynchus clarkii lewisi TaxID=490388 RepID=UPI0039B8CEB7